MMRRTKIVFAVIIILCLLIGGCKKEEIPESEKPITILAILLGIMQIVKSLILNLLIK